ncbi:hypothetical protein B0H19DRAFT_940681 [Mycena capillaripes]|nr:hypothetical protein B0H19DRAFT_940681 [Mycena capillaripes]
MLDLLDNLPRLRLSDDQLKTIIWVVRECRTPDVPSFSALRKKQAQLTADLNIKSKRHVSAVGNEFYMNHPADLLALDWANPLIREFIQVYPEITEKISEFIQADKWTKEVNVDELSPMWADWKNAAHKHFYVKELARLKNGNFVVPVRWIIFKKEEYAEVHNVAYDVVGKTFIIIAGEIVRVKATELRENYLDLCAQLHDLNFVDPSPEWAHHMPNPIRTIAKGRPVFSIRIVPWSDDVSGNVSKQFNPHMNIYIANANLPHRKVAQEYFVRFCSTSPHASSGEQFEALAEDLDPKMYHEAYDCQLQQEILFRLFAHVLPADNPQQAESASNAGVHSNQWCRYDDGGGTSTHRETNEGYCALFKPGNPRTPAETIRTIRRQIWLACAGVQDVVDNLQTATGVKDKTAQFWIEKVIVMAREQQQQCFKEDLRLKKKSLIGDARRDVKTKNRDLIQWRVYNWVIRQPEDRYARLPMKSCTQSTSLRPGDHYNILLSIKGLDPHQDSPCEILHTILLGDDKYVWHETNTKWDKAKGEAFAVRLQSSSTNGLNLASIRGRYMVKYKNALIGKHFKILQQLGIFHLHDDLCSPYVFDLWRASGELGALLWFPVIRNMRQYLADIQICIDNVLDIWGLIDPARIVTKFKLHVLPHIPDDVRRFGPLILSATEGFECWNKIFRLCSILSNHQAPSHDVGVTLADMERFKHQVSGGWWKPSSSSEYIRAGHKVASFLDQNKELQRRLGWMDKSKPNPGTIKLESRRKAITAAWRESLGVYWTPELDARGAGKLWKSCKYVIAKTGDVCTKLSWVFFKSQETGVISTGRIRNILIPVVSATHHKEAVVIVQRFDVSATRDARMHMPVLSPSPEIIVAQPEDILFFVNAQHDCHGLKCRTVNNAEHVTQERSLTGRTQAAVKHVETEIYFLNMHGLHNAELIRDTLPRSLTAPIPYFEDRTAKRREFAALLRVSGPAKRAATQKKAKETREKNQRAKDGGKKKVAPELEDEDDEEFEE